MGLFGSRRRASQLAAPQPWRAAAGFGRRRTFGVPQLRHKPTGYFGRQAMPKLWRFRRSRSCGKACFDGGQTG